MIATTLPSKPLSLCPYVPVWKDVSQGTRGGAGPRVGTGHLGSHFQPVPPDGLSLHPQGTLGSKYGQTAFLNLIYGSFVTVCEGGC